MGTKNEFQDDDDYRPLEPHEQQALSEKRLQKVDSRLNRMEDLIENLTLALKKLLRRLPGNSKTQTTEEKTESKDKERTEDDRSDFLDEREKKTSDHINTLSKQEVTLTHEVGRRRKQDRWYNLVMMDCRFKYAGKNHQIMCTKTEKRCNYKNCPIKNEADIMTA